MSVARAAFAAAERGWLPDPVLRAGVRALVRGRLRRERDRGETTALPASVDGGTIAVETRAANEQHYEVPPEFFRVVLGPWMKYSCCLWDGVETLAGAEEAMLAATAERAGFSDGQEVLDLGCGWGSLTLWAARRFPRSRFLAVSNAVPQRRFIERRAAELGLANVEARTADVNAFDPGRRFERIVSIEMMEHVRDHPALFERLAGWLEPGGALFAHVFCHRSHAYPFRTEEAGEWMARRFFTGGVMPSEETLPTAARRGGGGSLELEDRWRVSGRHYERTAEAWLERLDTRADEARSALAGSASADGVEGAGGEDPERARIRWRLFFLAVAETFGYRDGDEWGVAHYRWRRSGSTTGTTR